MTDPVLLPDATAPATPAAPRRRDPAAARRLWAERLDRFRSAGQTVAAFCAAEGVSVPTFYQWRRQLAAEAGPAEPPALVPVRLAPAVPAPIELVLPGGAVLRFASGTDPAVIAAVVRQIGVAGC
jgi:transposase